MPDRLTAGTTAMDTVQQNPRNNNLSRKLFSRLSEFIYNESGIKIPLSKKIMLEARLAKRLKATGLGTYEAYCSYLFSRKGAAAELVHMIDVVTTNKTDFFRESQHFDYLVKTSIPKLMETTGAGLRRPLLVWSAACSSGEEPYTLAMVLEEFARDKAFQYLILGTDISTRMLETARLGIYPEERIMPVSMDLRRKYLMRSKDRSRSVIRIIPELRSRVRFRRVNFMDPDFGFSEKMDIVFCRNVLIYFDRQTQEKVLDKICRYLNTGGYLFTGHSETLSGTDLPLEAVANTVSRKI
jgi:chemotaxis protein methyltransferase CheR